MTVTDGGEPRRVEVPVEMPEGVSHDGVFGKEENKARATGFVAEYGRQVAQPNAPPPPAKVVKRPVPAEPQGVAGGVGSGSGPGAGSGTGYGSGGGGGTRSQRPTETPKDKRDADEAQRNRPLSAAEQKHQQLLAKLHPAIAAVVERVKNKNGTPAAVEAKFVRNGKAEIQVWLTSKSDATMAKLKQLGFEVIAEPKTAKLVIGRIALDKLTAIAELSEVRYVAPQTQ
jgi:hypothetical protein